MKFARADQEELSLNLAPLIDVVFLLLIFFMVTASFNQNSTLDLTLPEANTEQTQDQTLMLKISITERDKIIISTEQQPNAAEQEQVPQGTLPSRIEHAIEQLKAQKTDNADTTPTILIEADKAASHGRVIQLMDAIAKLGINKIQFSVDPTQP